MKNLLSIDDLKLIYHTKTTETTAIDGISFSVDDGEFVSIIGPSGCGKTSVLSLIAGLVDKSGGTITFKGRPVNGSCKNVGYMLQKDCLFEWRTIENNLYLPLEIAKCKTKESVAYVDGLLQKYKLKEFAKYYPSQLSGGMRQRAALIRTLSTKPDLLLLDEPFSALDYQTRLSVCDDVYSIIRQERKTAILVTHDITEAISLSDKIVVLSERPSCVKKIFKTNFDRLLSPVKRRETESFSKWFEILYKELKV